MNHDAMAYVQTIGASTVVSLQAIGLLDDVRYAIERNPQGAHAAALRLVEVLSPSAEPNAQGTRGGLAPWQKRKVDRYMREHLARPLHVEEFAAQVQLSASHFAGAFRTSFGTSPHRYIIQLRLELAQRLMLTTKDSLCHIALRCGMADQSHLTKLFRRAVGDTPDVWRRRNLSDAEAEARSRYSSASQRLAS